MATKTNRPGAEHKLESTGARKTASAKHASGKTASTKATTHILDAAKGPRTISHRKIKEAIDKVFRERSHARD